MAELLIFTGPVKSGKTTELMHWALTKKNIDGIFQPIIEEKRFLYHITSKTLKQFEADKKINVVEIGNYKLLQESFDWAKNILMRALEQPLDYLIIDEVGPLELEGKGLEPTITELLRNEKKFLGKIIFVVRESLLDKFIQHYKLETKYNLFKT